ncbi:MAG: aspartate aminotransferase family protein [Gammaproteobacteria bacterium]
MESPLFDNAVDRIEVDDWLTRRLYKSLESITNGKASPTLDLDTFRDELAGKDFASGEPLEPLLEWTIGRMEQGAVQMTHPRYFGLFNPAPSFPAECADRIGAVLNPQICVLSHAPVAVLIERHVIRQLGRRAGFRDAVGGHFTSGGSEANLTSAICALTRALPEFAEEGGRAFSGQPRLYVSKESHLAWLKIAHTTGIGRVAVRLIDTDGNGRLCTKALRLQVEADVQAGDVPVMIAATFGTTNAGMIDPVEACSNLAREHNMWLHVDAAWGGALIADESQTSVFGGIELADSLTIDAHKWFATTMGTGMFITPHPQWLEASFHAKASYMPSGDAEVDYYLTSMQWSRRFSGLRLFLNLAAGGWYGVAKHIQRGQRLIERLNHALTIVGWSVVNDSVMAVSCLVPPGDDESTRRSAVAGIVDEVVERGNAWVSVAIMEDQPVVRVCITNGNTTETDIDQLAKELQSACST